MNLLKEKGAIVVETTMSLTFFIFAMLMILSITNICLAQSKIGTALNSAAIELSEYSYLYKLTGLAEKHKEWAEKGSEANEQIGNVANGVSELYSSVSSIAETGNHVDMSDFSSVMDTYNSVKDNVGQASASFNQIKETMEEIADDPKAFILGVGALIGTEAWNRGNTWVSGMLGKAFMKKHLTDEKDGSCEDYLKWLRIIPQNGSYLDSLNFSQSKVFENGVENIDLVVTYKIRVISLLGIKKDFRFTQRAQTKGWFGNSGGE